MSVRDLQTVFGFATSQAIYKWQNGLAMPTLDNIVILASENTLPFGHFHDKIHKIYLILKEQKYKGGQL